MAQGGKSPNPRNYDPSRPLSEQIPIPKLSLEDRLAIKKYSRAAADVTGKLWTAPNTALGLAAGGMGYVVGKVAGTKPGISLGGNAVRFTNNPVGGVSAITLGNVAIYSPNRQSQPDYRDRNGVTVQEHERQHTLQAQLLGPLYLPSNIAGGLYSLSKGKGWHGQPNWNERGPQKIPPRPWAK